MSDDRRTTNRNAVDRAFLGVSHADVDEMLCNYSRDMVLEMPYADPPVRLDGRETVRDYLRGAFEIFKFRLWVTDVHECADPDELVIEYASDGHVTTTGKPYANTYIGWYRFRDGEITFVREWYNPAATAKSFSTG